jgi:hypothetical protein
VVPLAEEDDPILEALMNAPEDKEPLDDLETAGIEEGLRDIARGDTRPWDEVKIELGLEVKANFTALVAAIVSGEHKNDDLQSVEDFFQDCGRYIGGVVHMEAAIIAARDRMDDREYREHLAQLDHSRKVAHDTPIASVKLLNRLCR